MGQIAFRSLNLLNGFDLLLGFYQVRDITTNPEWERAYQYEIPVLARVRSDGTEVSHFQFPILCFSHDFVSLFFHVGIFLLLGVYFVNGGKSYI